MKFIGPLPGDRLDTPPPSCPAAFPATWRIMGLSKYGYKYLKWGYKYL